MEKQQNENHASRILRLTKTETEVNPGDEQNTNIKQDVSAKKKDKKKKKKPSKTNKSTSTKQSRSKNKQHKRDLPQPNSANNQEQNQSTGQQYDEENAEATIISLGRAKPFYTQEQINNNNTRQRGRVEQPTQQEVRQQEHPEQEQRPGAFRIFGIWGARQNQRDDYSNSSSSQEEEPQQEPEIPTANVQQLTARRRQEEQRELFEPEQELDHQSNDNSNRNRNRKKNKEDDNFAIIAAAVFGILIIGAVVATIVLVRGSQDGNDKSNGNTSPTQAPGNIFDSDLRDKWDGSDDLFLYAVQLGYDWSECTIASPSGILPAPTITMTCSEGGTIEILKRTYFDRQAQPIPNEDKHDCNNDQGSLSQISCMEDPSTVEDGLTVIWMVGCAADNLNTQLSVESTFEIPSALTCGASDNGGGISYSASHSLSMGLYCFDESISPPSVDFSTVGLQCFQGEEGMVGQTHKDQLDIPFCGQFASCQNGPCRIRNVDSLNVHTTQQKECALSKIEDQSFADLLNVEEQWSQLSFNFNIHGFAENAHTVLTTP